MLSSTPLRRFWRIGPAFGRVRAYVLDTFWSAWEAFAGADHHRSTVAVGAVRPRHRYDRRDRR